MFAQTDMQDYEIVKKHLGFKGESPLLLEKSLGTS